MIYCIFTQSQTGIFCFFNTCTETGLTLDKLATRGQPRRDIFWPLRLDSERNSGWNLSHGQFKRGVISDLLSKMKVIWDEDWRRVPSCFWPANCCLGLCVGCRVASGNNKCSTLRLHYLPCCRSLSNMLLQHHCRNLQRNEINQTKVS